MTINTDDEMRADENERIDYAEASNPNAEICAWECYRYDFSVMTDAAIEFECENARNAIDEAEDWLEAVAAWELAGKPREERN